MERVPFQKWIVLLLFEPVGRARTLLVPRGHVTRDWFVQRFCLGAFESDNFLRHLDYSFVSAGVASSSSASPRSSSVKPKREVTDWRTREALFCFSSCDWHWTVKRANGIASSRARGMGLVPDQFRKARPVPAKASSTRNLDRRRPIRHRPDAFQKPKPRCLQRASEECPGQHRPWNRPWRRGVEATSPSACA